MKHAVRLGLCLFACIVLQVERGNAFSFGVPEVTAGATATITWNRQAEPKVGSPPDPATFVIFENNTEATAALATITDTHGSDDSTTVVFPTSITRTVEIAVYGVFFTDGSTSTDFAHPLFPPATVTAATTSVLDSSTKSSMTTDLGNSGDGNNGVTSTLLSASSSSAPTSESVSDSSGALTTSPNSESTTSTGLDANATSSAPASAAATKKSSRTAIIIGATVGGAVLVAILLTLPFFCAKRRRTQPRPNTFHRDMMVRSPENSSYRDQASSQGKFTPATVTRRTLSTSSASSIILDNEKTPALTAYVRAVEGSSHCHGDRPEYAGRPDARESLSRYASTLTTNTSYAPHIAPRTDRQMELQERIHHLQAELISLHDSESHDPFSTHANGEIEDVKTQIRQLEELQQSDWALQQTDDIPRNYGNVLFRARFGV